MDENKDNIDLIVDCLKCSLSFASDLGLRLRPREILWWELSNVASPTIHVAPHL